MAESPAPVVEMLWEPDDPHHTLAGRFGFSDGPAAGRWVAGTLHEHWGIHVDSCERIVMSAGNALAWTGTPSGRLLAKWSVVPERFPRLSETARLTSWLHGRGLPVSAPIPARDGRLQVEVGRVSIGVQHEIDGDLLDPTDPGQVRAAGAALARLQDALAAYPDADRIPAPAGPSQPVPARITDWLDSRAGHQPLPARITDWLDSPAGHQPLPARITDWLDSRAGHLPTAARDTLRRLVDGAPPDRLPRQLVHFDIRSANILCARGKIAAILDFEEARHDHPLLELARAAILLGTRYHDWGPVPPEVCAEFLAGYQSERPLTRGEADWLNILLLWQSLKMVPPGNDPTGWGPSALTRLNRPRSVVARALDLEL